MITQITQYQFESEKIKKEFLSDTQEANSSIGFIISEKEDELND